MKTYKVNDKVTVSDDRCPEITGTAVLTKERPDLSEKWSNISGMETRVWEALHENQTTLVSQNMEQYMDGEFVIEPDFDDDLQ